MTSTNRFANRLLIFGCGFLLLIVGGATAAAVLVPGIRDAWKDTGARVTDQVGSWLQQTRLAGLEVSWCRASYRYRTVRQIPGAPALSSVFVCVLQPALDGRLLVGQMSASTSSPGLIQLPGGNLEPSPPGEELTLDALRRHASTELAEETGIVADPDDLTPWVAARTSNGNVGFFFLAPSLATEFILEQHASVVRADRQNGREPEFAEIALVSEADELDRLSSRSADYLRPLLDRFRSA
jgi:8-oxo-dGTP pyrophosphatase MutT (NUDIX family)